MSAVMATMPVTIPLFASASASSSSNQTDGTQPKSGAATSHSGDRNLQFCADNVASGDPLDFDLLAEYLLDDGTAALGAVPAFDFSSDTPPATTQQQPQLQPGVVSPEQVENSFVDPLADAAEQLKQAGFNGQTGDLAGDLAQVQQMIAAQAEAAEMQINVSSITKSEPTPTSAPVPPPSAPATHAPIPPAPSAAPYLPVATAPVQFPAPVTVPAPVPASPAVVSPPTLSIPPPPQLPIPASLPANSSPRNKRRRVENTTTAQIMINGNNHFLPSAIDGKNGRKKSQEQIDRRRERNRILARRTRLRKKFFFESLQKDVLDLQRENFVLKDIVRKRLKPEAAKEVLDSCKASEQLPSIISEQGEENGILTELHRQDFNLIESVQKSQQCFVITDPSLQDNPIVYASDDFLTLTGYARNDVLGRNCRFLQGTETHPTKIEKIRKAVEVGEDCTVTMINYAADGTAFWNNLFIAPLRDAENNIVNFIGVIVKVAAPEPGDIEAGKTLPGEATNLINGIEENDLLHDNSGAADIAAAQAAEGTVMAIEDALPSAETYPTVPVPATSFT